MSMVRGMHRWLKCKRKSPLQWLYGWSTTPWSWWPIRPPGSTILGRRRKNGRTAPPAQRRIAYYLWHFPVLSQTFVQREVEALKKCGLSLTVFAQGVEDLELLDEAGRALLQSTLYVEPMDKGLLARYKSSFFRASPLTYLNLFLFVMSRRYGLSKRWSRDRKLFATAVYLAGHLQERRIDHIHSPWADRCGFAVMLAARLLDIPFSVQARAHDLHDPSYQNALPDMFRNAEFVITNTCYNRSFIRSHLKRAGPDIHTIYNGIDLADFVPPQRGRRRESPIRILCVARLIEQKGLIHLLEACALLREHGLAFRCEVIGGAEEPLYSDYLGRLREAHRRLKLEGDVLFRGARPFAEVMEAYRSADLFVLPCVIARDGRRDITPNALIEAMAMKLPVVSTAITGIPEIVENGVSGLLVPAGDPTALADAVESLVRDPTLAWELGENGRRQVESRFDLYKNVRSYLRLFSTVPIDDGAERATTRRPTFLRAPGQADELQSDMAPSDDLPLPLHHPRNHG